MFLKDTPGRTCIHNEDFCSIGIVSFNRHARLNKLIDSIHKHADMPFELVVSDDGGLLYDNYNFISGIKDRVSHVAVNLGRNKGLHVNSNTAVSMTRSKYVMLFYDDVEIEAPFMRECVNTLRTAPYVGVIYLGNSYNANGHKSDLDTAGIIAAKTTSGIDLSLMCKHGGTWAAAFRKDYWYEVGGYSEDDIYGDLPFINKGWKKGYFAAVLNGPQRARDMDKDVHGHTNDSTGKFTTTGFANYPKLFRVKENKLMDWDRERGVKCAYRNHSGRAEKFNDYDQHSWSEYMETVTNTGKIDWDILKSNYHGRFIDQLKRDVLPMYSEG